MSVQSDFTMSLRIIKSLTVGGQQVSVALQSVGNRGSLTATSQPASKEGWKGDNIAVDGDVEIDLTNLSMVVESGSESAELTIDLTGWKILQAEFVTPSGNGGTAITIAPGDTNGYPIGERTLEGNSSDGFFRPGNTNEVGPTSKIIKLSSEDHATIDILLVAGE